MLPTAVHLKLSQDPHSNSERSLDPRASILKKGTNTIDHFFGMFVAVNVMFQLLLMLIFVLVSVKEDPGQNFKFVGLTMTQKSR